MEPISFRFEYERAAAFGLLDELTRNGPLGTKVKLIHTLIRRRFDFIDRVAVALYDSNSSQLKTFVSSGDEKDPLSRYQFPLKEAFSLLEVITKGPRVINDLSVFSGGLQQHTKKILEQGYKASYTVPMLYDDAFCGFIFVNSYKQDCFSEEVVAELDVYCHVIMTCVVQGITSIKILQNAIKTAGELAFSRNSVTGMHMARMSQISRCIAEGLVASGKYSFDDEVIERLALFSTLHDVGKMAIPDSILLKRERLDEKEFAIMTTHAQRGLEMIDVIISNFNLQTMAGIQMLRNIVLSHHEKMDGSGYPFRLKGQEIPIEARIVAVADMYSALTSERPHRPAFSSAEAFDRLEKHVRRLDPDCVAALVEGRSKIESAI